VRIVVAEPPGELPCSPGLGDAAEDAAVDAGEESGSPGARTASVAARTTAELTTDGRRRFHTRSGLPATPNTPETILRRWSK
jgi:hypothetical protein